MGWSVQLLLCHSLWKSCSSTIFLALIVTESKKYLETVLPRITLRTREFIICCVYVHIYVTALHITCDRHTTNTCILYIHIYIHIIYIHAFYTCTLFTYTLATSNLRLDLTQMVSFLVILKLGKLI